MRLVYVRDSRAKGYTVLGIDSGDGARAYTVETALYMRIGSPLPSDEIDDGDFADVAFADEVFRATKKALSLLTYSDNNKKTLFMKLKKAGFSADAAKSAVQDMMRLGYINEERQLERLIIAEAKLKLQGRRKFIPKLVAKGYERALVDSVLEKLLESGEIDFDIIAEELVAKKLGDDPDPEAVRILLYKNGLA
ncbi:MAG: RecX family transcriptional regulator [Clostridia bacterium]|nr:RecX family transcriptional regulator [Clostridia bacterium]